MSDTDNPSKEITEDTPISNETNNNNSESARSETHDSIVYRPHHLEPLGHKHQGSTELSNENPLDKPDPILSHQTKIASQPQSETPVQNSSYSDPAPSSSSSSSSSSSPSSAQPSLPNLYQPSTAAPLSARVSPRVQYLPENSSASSNLDDQPAKQKYPQPTTAPPLQHAVNMTGSVKNHLTISNAEGQKPARFRLNSMDSVLSFPQEEDDNEQNQPKVLDKIDDDSMSEADDIDDNVVQFDRREYKRRKKTFAYKFERFYNSLTYVNIKNCIRYYMESATFNFKLSFEDVILILTIYILFADDIKIMTTDREADHAFSVSYMICFCIFLFDIIVNTWCRTTFLPHFPYIESGYALSFYWWIDVISTFCIVPDIHFLANGIGIETETQKGSYSQVGKIVRLVRLVRLIQIYRRNKETKLRLELEEDLNELHRLNVITYDQVEKEKMLIKKKQSKIGEQIALTTTKKVIILIVLLLIVIPLLSYNQNNYGPSFAMEALHAFHLSHDVTDESKSMFMNSFLDSLQKSYKDDYVVYLDLIPQYPDFSYINNTVKLDDLRPQSELVFSLYSTFIDSLYATSNLTPSSSPIPAPTKYYTNSIFNISELIYKNAMFSLLTTVFIGLMMFCATIIFSRDAQDLVIAPIERMSTLVDAVAQNPLANFDFHHDESGSAGEFETRLLETTIKKITGLLRVGFGEAGAGIISANLSTKDVGDNDSNESKSKNTSSINPLLRGIRVYAIFGFCDIHHFEDINQKLSNDVLTFVNTIAEIVHNNVHNWSGQCNKNLGNAFVIVWRIGDEVTLQASQGMTFRQGQNKPKKAQKSVEDEEPVVGKKKKHLVDLRRVPGVDILADHALIAYLKIIVEINRNKRVLKYRQEPRLTNNGRTEFKVRMGFGLHAGWAIEGAVGSLQKVDATYLSPHVNMAARLETSSRQYGVPLLFSQDFFDLMSPDGQEKCRKLDVVTVKGSEVPIGIYTYDALQDQEFKEEKNKRAAHLHQYTNNRASLRKNSVRGRLDSSTSTNLPGAPISSPNQINTKKNNQNDGTTFRNTNNNTSINNNNGSGSNTPGTSTPPRRPSFTPGTTSNGSIVLKTSDDPTDEVFDYDYDLLTLRQHASLKFFSVFKEGIDFYLQGDWGEARTYFEKSNKMMLDSVPALGGDGPSQTLLRYMADHDYKAPKWWKGYRPLTSK